jgi:solute carrier family 13 (sodium-dependent dicarboxylate transporter), member 2/3/5
LSPGTRPRRVEPLAPEGAAGLRERVGLIAGPLVFAAMLLAPAPAGLSPDGWRVAAAAVLMAVWWMTEALPIPATALLPLVLFPALGVLDMPQTAAPYANEIIFLFMGGFLLAAAMERWGLHRRIALRIVAAVGTSPRGLVLGFMVATAFLSMWISNTATVAMMLPIAIALAAMFRPSGEGPYQFGTALMLGIAYAASIGGVATLIGTPPNAVFAAAAGELLGVQIGFFEWMLVGVPLAVVFVPVCWALLVGLLYPPGPLAGDADALISQERAAMGRASRAEKMVFAVFVATALAWIMRAPKPMAGFTVPGIQTLVPQVEDSTIAMAAAILLFLLPVDWRRGVFVLDWRTASRIPWGVLLLFGGGLSLARAMSQSGLAAWIGGGVTGLSVLPGLLVVGAVAALFVFLTEVTSNTATAAMAMPVMAGAGVALGIEPLLLMATAALASSMAFMLPVATPPNAIVFGSGCLTVPQMVRAGVWMNVVAILLITLLASQLLPLLVR